MRVIDVGEGRDLSWAPLHVRIHEHARQRMVERGATEAEVIATVRQGERFAAKFGRFGFRRNFALESDWNGKTYATKQIEAFAVDEKG